MIKYDCFYTTFQEVPNETSLTFTITNCQKKCKGCHSPWLQKDVGLPLYENIDIILRTYDGMYSCVCFMGEGNDLYDLLRINNYIKEVYKTKTAIYSGKDCIEDWMYEFDYIKIGSYIEKYGGLTSESTNQKMFKNDNCNLLDITKAFIKNYR